MERLALLLVVVVSGWVTRSAAQAWEVFDDVTASLPSVTVTALAEDRNGIMWVGTDFGLCRYESGDWTVTQPTEGGLPDYRISALAVDTANGLWVGTVLGGLAHFDGTQWTVFNTTNSGLPDDQITCLTVDHRNWLWIGTYLGLVCYTGDEWRLYNDTEQSYDGAVLNGTVIRDVQVRSDGLVAIGTLNGGFHYLSGSVVQVHATYIDQFFDNTQNGVAFDPISGDRWLACPAQGLLRNFGDWQGGTWFQYATWNSDLPSNALISLALDASGSPWMGSVLNGLIHRRSDGSFEAFTTSNSGIPDNGVTRLLFASDGSLWVGTYEGGAARMTFSTGYSERPVSRASLYAEGDVCWVSGTDAEGGTLQWQLLDGTGRSVRSGRANAAEKWSFPIGGLGHGAYQVVLVGSRSREVLRFVR